MTEILDEGAVSEIEAQLDAAGPGGELSVEQMNLNSNSQATALNAKEIVDQFEALRTSSSLIDVEVSYGYLMQAISTLQTRAATAMRDKCVSVTREIGDEVLAELAAEISLDRNSFSVLKRIAVNKFLQRLRPELASLTLDQVKPGET